MHVRTSSPFQPKRSLVTWLITLLLIICPSSYKARPDNLIGPNSFCSGIVSPQRSNARPNFPTSNVMGGAKFIWHPGYIDAVDHPRIITVCCVKGWMKFRNVNILYITLPIQYLYYFIYTETIHFTLLYLSMKLPANYVSFLTVSNAQFGLCQ